jgi:hypothetical protein
MIILDENSKPVSVHSIEEPISADFFWVLDLAQRDFLLTPLVMLEEIHTPTLTFTIGKATIVAPADWNILVYSQDTYQIDIVEIQDLTRGGYSAFLMDHKLNRITKNDVTVVDYHTYGKIHVPTMNKNVMLCIAVGPDHWICMAPTDNYMKLLKDCAVGDILP